MMYHHLMEFIFADHPAVEWAPFFVPALVIFLGLGAMVLVERRRTRADDRPDAR